MSPAGAPATAARFGVNLMAQGWTREPILTGPALMRHRARLLRRMTEAGLDHVMIGDHVMFHGGTGNDGLTDAASVMTATGDLGVYLAVYLLVLRHPLTVARQILTVAQFGPGRLCLGVGIAGDDRREVEACGVDPRTRGRRMDEALDIVRRLLAGGTVSHQGEFFQLDQARLQPALDEPVPLVVGGRSEAALRRAGRLGDGWLGIWTTAERCAEAIGIVEEHATRAGRREVSWRHGMTFWCGFGADRRQARERVAPVMEGLYRLPFAQFERFVPYGPPEQVAEFVTPFIRAGVTAVNFIPFASSHEAGIDAVADVREQVLKALLPKPGSAAARPTHEQRSIMSTASDQLSRSAEFHAAGYWGDDTFPALIDRWADDDPQRPYLADGTSAVTYGQFRDQAWTLAAQLAGLGLVSGDRVAVQLPNWNEYFLIYAACARLGVIMIPITTVYRATEVKFIVANSGAAALISCGEFRGFDHAAMAAKIAGDADHRVRHIVARAAPPANALGLADLMSGSQPAGTLPGPPAADDPHLILYSSGTESQPKGCLHTWNTSSFLPKQAIPAMGMTRDDVMFMPAPVTHALGLTLGLMAPTLAGASVELLDIFRPAVALERVSAHGCTGTASPAPFIRMMLDAYDPTAHDVSRLRFWLTAGAAIPAALVEEAASRFRGCRVVSAYGSSEVMMATVCRPDDPIERVASSDGSPVPGVDLRIVNDGEPAPTGGEGEIEYRGPGRLLEYWQRPDLTTAAMDEGWWRTGDVGRLDEAGYLRVTGRIKDIIIRGGFNISAREVEEALLAHPAVAAAAVVGLPDAKLGERACAVIEVVRGQDAPSLADLRDYLTTDHQLAVWKVPERLEVTEKWPVTATGKVQKYVLRDTFRTDN